MRNVKIIFSIIGSIGLLYMTLSGSESDKWPFLVFVLSIGWMRFLHNEKLKESLNKIYICVFLILFVSTFGGGFLYKTYYPHQVEARWQHLLGVSDSIEPLPGAKFESSEKFMRSFAQSYSMRHLSDADTETIKRHYVAELRRLDYEMFWNGRDRLTGKKDGVIVIVEWGRGRLNLHVEFDDFFQRWAI